MSRWLLIIGLTELVLIGTCVAAVFGNGLWLRHSAGPRKDRLINAHMTLRSYFDTGELSEEADRAVRRLSLGERLDLFSALAGTFQGRERQLAHDLAVNLGVLDFAARKCKSRIWSRRLKGVRIFTLAGGGQASVLSLFGDSRTEVRAAAAEWASEHPTPEVIDHLIAMLDDTSTLCRFTVKDSLLRLGPAATPALTRYLMATDSPPEEALEVATWISDPAFLKAARRFQMHPDVTTRVRVIELIASIGGTEATSLLEVSVSDPDSEVRAAGLRALGKLERWQSAQLLMIGLADEEWQVRKQAGLALSALGAPGALLLKQSLSSKDANAADMARHILDTPTVGDKRGGIKP